MFLLVFTVADFVVLWGLWTMKRWAWSVAMFLFALGVGASIVSLFAGNPVGGLVGLITGVPVTVYLYSVRREYQGPLSVPATPISRY
ncbi:hypothetical protein [Haloarchaeobius sp. DFWS5]|uniref:hypothetical protein n=1 Tax=Haloarchaeobius sp. DFWS5 TaxID=3446114 RepID=UPI003EB9F474